MSEPEFSRTVRADTIGATPREMNLSANPAERKALARRFGVEAIEALTAEAFLTRSTHDVIATGRVTAEVVQSCVVSGAPVPARVEEEFAVRFRPEAGETGAEEEIELAEDELDVMFHDGALIDVGEAVAQTLALNLDPYPRATGAGETLKEAGVLEEGEAGPFGALAELRDKLIK